MIEQVISSLSRAGTGLLSSLLFTFLQAVRSILAQGTIQVVHVHAYR